MRFGNFMAAAIGIAGFTTLTAPTAQAQLKVAVIENLSGPDGNWPEFRHRTTQLPSVDKLGQSRERDKDEPPPAQLICGVPTTHARPSGWPSPSSRQRS